VIAPKRILEGALFSLAFLCPLSLAQIDPLRPAEEPPLGYRLSFTYRPSGGQGVGVDEAGPYAFQRAGHDLGLGFVLAWRATPDLTLEGGGELGYLLVGEVQERAGGREVLWRGERAWGLRAGVAYRLAGLPGRPRVYLGLGYPWRAEGEVSMGFLRDPVVATGVLGLTYPWGKTAYLGVGLGLALVLNEVYSLGVGASLHVPLGVEPPGGSLFLRAGYSLDPEGKEEVAVRAGYGDGGFGFQLEVSGAL